MAVIVIALVASVSLVKKNQENRSQAASKKIPSYSQLEIKSLCTNDCNKTKALIQKVLRKNVSIDGCYKTCSSLKINCNTSNMEDAVKKCSESCVVSLKANFSNVTFKQAKSCLNTCILMGNSKECIDQYTGVIIGRNVKCTPNCNCAKTTLTGKTCPNGCGGTCTGSKGASVPTCASKGGVCVPGVSVCTKQKRGKVISGTNCSGSKPVCCK